MASMMYPRRFGKVLTSNMMAKNALLRNLAIVFLCATFVLGQEGFDGFGEPKFCPPFKCPKGQTPVPKWPLSLESSGCMNMGGMQVMSSPTESDDPQEQCCHLRNACLQTCGAAKFFCDEGLTKCTAKVCEAIEDSDAKTKCESSANIHNIMLKLDQCTKYDAYQKSHCECVPTSKVPEKRERIIRNFYKKYRPENIDKVAGLAAKADTPGKLVSLLVKLYTKYPQAIKKVKDPQQEYMERIMRESKQKQETGEDKPVQEESDAEDLGTEEL